MSSSVISKLKPSCFNKSSLDDKIIVINRLTCRKNINSLEFNIKSIDRKISNFLHSKSYVQMLKEILTNVNWHKDMSVLIASFNSCKELEYIPNCDMLNLDIVGIDVSLKKLKKVDKLYSDNLDISLVECCVQDLPFIDNQFDVVINIGSFNSFKNRITAIKEMLRVTKDEGNIIVADRVRITTQKMLENLERELDKLSLNYDISSINNDKYYTISFNPKFEFS